jgi:hypothetical protein
MQDAPERWIALPGDGAIKSERSATLPAQQPRGIGQPRNERLAVSAISRVVTAAHTRTVRIVGVSATTALVLSPRLLGHVGQCIDLFLPVLGNRELRLTAGIASVERAGRGHAVVLHFMIAELAIRQQLNELVALLLAGESNSARHQPRVIYDVPVRYGPRAERIGHLEDLSPADLAMRVHERLPNTAPIRVTIPAFNGNADLALAGRVVGQRLAPEGGYHTSVVFESLDDTRRRSLSALIADLMCR